MGHIVGVVLDPISDDLEAIEFGIVGGGIGGDVAEAVGGDVTRAVGDATDAIRGLMGDAEAYASEGELALGKGLTDDAEAMMEEEVAVAANAATEGVLYGEGYAVRDPEFCLGGHLKPIVEDSLVIRVGLASGCLAEGPQNALAGHAELGPVHRHQGEVGDG